MTSAENLAVLTPPQIDERLAAAYRNLAVSKGRRAQYARILNPADGRPALSAYYAAEAQTKLEQAQAAIDAAQALIDPLNAEFDRRGGWSRYFLVTNTGGHVHREMNCSTCYPSTEYAWVTDLSDCDEAAMIVEFGERACSVCFPDAPANPAFHAPGRRDAEAVAARAAEKAAKRAEKDAKAITAADGGPLRTKSFGVISTERTAEIEYVHTVAYVRRLEKDATKPEYAHLRELAEEYRADVVKLLAALAAKRGVAESAVADQLSPKVEKYYRREYDY